MEIKFSRHRLAAIIIKEYIQLIRNRATFAMLFLFPLLQLILYGYAINSDPRHLNTILLDQDNSIFTRALIKGMENSSYFHFVGSASTEQQAEDMLTKGDIQFIVNI